MVHVSLPARQGIDFPRRSSHHLINGKNPAGLSVAGNVNESDSRLAIGGHNNLRHTGAGAMIAGSANTAEWRGTALSGKRFVPVNNPRPCLQQQLIEFFPLGETRPQRGRSEVLFAIRIASSKLSLNARRNNGPNTSSSGTPVTPVISMIPSVPATLSPACNKSAAQAGRPPAIASSSSCRRAVTTCFVRPAQKSSPPINGCGSSSSARR